MWDARGDTGKYVDAVLFFVFFADGSVYGVEGNAATVSGFSLAWQSGVCVKLFPGAVCFSAKVIVLWKRMFLNGCVLLRACCVVL